MRIPVAEPPRPTPPPTPRGVIKQTKRNGIRAAMGTGGLLNKQSIFLLLLLLFIVSAQRRPAIDTVHNNIIYHNIILYAGALYTT